MEQKTSTLPESALVIEDDEILANMVVGCLKDLGVKHIDSFQNGAKGLNAALKGTYQIVLLDWMIPGATGLQIFNHLKNDKRYHLVPILVMSGMISKKDFSILGDFPLASLIEKPFQVSFLAKQVVTLFRESLWYHSQGEAIATYFEQLDGENSPDQFYEFVTKSPNPYPLALIAGRYLKSLGRYPDAERFIKLAMHGKDSGLMATTELAKICLLTGRDAEAKAMLKKAQTISPNNIDRICDLGSISLKEMDTKTADQYFRSALAIDGGNERAMQGKNLVANIDNWTKNSKTIPHNYASLLNAIGIGFVRQKAFDQGISHYKSAMSQIFDNETKARIGFNLGLGYAKQKNFREALVWLKNASQIFPDFEKAKKYVDILERLIQEEEEEKKGKGKKKVTKVAKPEKEIKTKTKAVVQEHKEPKKDESKVEEAPAPQKLFESDDFFEPIGDDDISEVEYQSSDFNQPEPDAPQEEGNEDFNSLPEVGRLKEACPQIDEFYKILIKEGVYLQGQIPLLTKLLQQHGDKAFNQVISEATKNQVTSILTISSMFANVKKKRK